MDVEDGKPPLKLPYNQGDDPYKAATAFLTRNNLPSGYLEQVYIHFSLWHINFQLNFILIMKLVNIFQVVDFILKNSKEQYVPPVSQYQDPFTGGSRYTPASNTGNATDLGMNLDPFTGKEQTFRYNSVTGF